MIQRLQTVYLLLALAATIACLCLPVASVEPKGMGLSVQVFNLFATTGDGAVSYSVWPLFMLLLITCPLTIAAIMLYKRRKLQMRLCYWNMVFCLVWYAYFVFMMLGSFQQKGTIHVSFGVCLPLVAIILYLLARRGIKKDDDLVRSSERIR